MKNEKVDIVTIGNIVKETIFLTDKIVGPVLGSPCAYTSLALAKAGKSTGIVTYCGEEMQKIITAHGGYNGMHSLYVYDRESFDLSGRCEKQGRVF